MLLPPVAGCATAEASPPPYYSHHWPGHPSTPPHPLLFYGDGSLTPQPNQGTLILLSARASTAAGSLAPRRPLPRPHRRPPPWCSRRAVVNVVNERHPSDVDCTWRGSQLGPWPHTRKCLLITRKIMIPPRDIWDPPEGPLYFVKKMSPPRTGRTHQLYLRTQGSASLLRTKKMNTPLLAGTQYSGPTKLTGTEGFVNLVNMHDSSSSDRTMSIQQPYCFFNL